MKICWVLALWVGLLPSTRAEGIANLELYDVTAHRVLPIYEHHGRSYVAGEPGHRYELHIRNLSSARVLAVTSVDGVNVLNGKTAAEHQSGYVIDPYDLVTVEGWRKSLDEVATFYFTTLADSYAARTARPDNVGVIGVALFREHRICCPHFKDDNTLSRESAPAAAESRGKANSRGEKQASARRANPSIGTGHGDASYSAAEYVDFQRASSTPDETLVIYYDSHANLIAKGVLPTRERFADDLPNAFPDRFVPDP
jgi:hypothetical protein